MLKNKFIAGLLVWIPLGGTILVVNFLLDIFDKIWVLIPEQYQPEILIGHKIPGLSILVVVIIIYITGYLVSNYFGKIFVEWWEKILDKIPGIRSFYRGIKQMTEAIFVSSNKSFRKVFLIEYPRRDLWTIAFETGESQGEPHYLIHGRESEAKASNAVVSQNVKRSANQDDQDDKVQKSEYVNLFVPTTPNPTSGYYIITKKSDLIELDMGVDDALKMIVSGGVFVPDYPCKT